MEMILHPIFGFEDSMTRPLCVGDEPSEWHFVFPERLDDYLGETIRGPATMWLVYEL